MTMPAHTGLFQDLLPAKKTILFFNARKFHVQRIVYQELSTMGAFGAAFQEFFKTIRTF